MKMKPNFKFLSIALVMSLMLGSCGVKKMVTNYEKVNFEVTPEVLRTDAGKIDFTIKGNYPPKYFKKKAVVELQPVLVSNDGAERMELKPVMFVGEKVAKKIRRAEAKNVEFNFKGLADDSKLLATKEVLDRTIPYKSGGSFTYTSSLDYLPAYNESDLMINGHVSGKNKVTKQDQELVKVDSKSQLELGSMKIADGVIHTGMRLEAADNMPNFRWELDENGMPRDINSWSTSAKSGLDENRMMYSNDMTSRYGLGELLLAKSGYEKQTLVSKEASIYFAKNLHSLNWNLPENKANNAKQQLASLKDFILLGWEIKEINIDGWASPEGEESFNEGLSERRANTAKEYMLGEMKTMVKKNPTKVKFKEPKNDVDWKATAHGPDWNGFLDKVENSKLSEKRAIMNVIQSSGQDKRETEIRNMILIYDSMEEDILPTLRRSEIKVTAFEPKLSDEDIARLSTTTPNELNDKELLYSATLTNNLKTQQNIYKSATRIYPNDWRGYNNAAYTELKFGNVEEASSYLEEAKRIDPANGIVLNNLGVMAALNRNYDQAESYFKKSQELGISQDYNLGVLMIPKGQYNKSIEMMRGKTCDYNLALAQVMAGKEADAAKNLECAPKTAATYYLLAVVGARTKNQTMMFNNLQKAIDENPMYRTTAAKDREFVKYYGDAEFVRIVQ
jgi:outer membrane protein OmpA-like peptidoglycan-associated protein